MDTAIKSRHDSYDHYISPDCPTTINPHNAPERKDSPLQEEQAGDTAVSIAYSLTKTMKMNGVDSRSWLAQVVACISHYDKKRRFRCHKGRFQTFTHDCLS
jgi:hypothetical protein